MLLSNIFSIDGPAAEQVDKCCTIIKSELVRWYAKSQAAGDTFTALQEFKSSMIGKASDRKLKLKAAETKDFCFFLNHLLKSRGANMDRRDIWIGASSNLVGLMEVMAAGHLVVGAQLRQDNWGVKPKAETARAKNSVYYTYTQDKHSDGNN
jgi:hypothetical protein